MSKVPSTAGVPLRRARSVSPDDGVDTAKRPRLEQDFPERPTEASSSSQIRLSRDSSGYVSPTSLPASSAPPTRASYRSPSRLSASRASTSERDRRTTRGTTNPPPTQASMSPVSSRPLSFPPRPSGSTPATYRQPPGGSATPCASTLSTPDEKILQGLSAGFLEGLDLVVRGLNVSWVPEPRIGNVEMIMREDGRFGPEDHLLWPQAASPLHPHLALIPRRPGNFETVNILWHSPGPADIRRANNHPDGEAFGMLRENIVVKLKDALATLDTPIASYRRRADAKLEELDLILKDLHDPDRPRYLARREAILAKQEELTRLEAQVHLAWDVFAAPSTSASMSLQWAHLHRCYAECWAWLEWQKVSDTAASGTPSQLHPGIANAGVVGVICDNRTTALRYYRAGVPVWLVAPAKATTEWRSHPHIVKVSTFQAETTMCTKPSPLALSARADVGDAHATTLWNLSASVCDFERLAVYKTLKNMPASGSSVLNAGPQSVVPTVKRMYLIFLLIAYCLLSDSRHTQRSRWW